MYLDSQLVIHLPRQKLSLQAGQLQRSHYEVSSQRNGSYRNKHNNNESENELCGLNESITGGVEYLNYVPLCVNAVCVSFSSQIADLSLYPTTFFFDMI